MHRTLEETEPERMQKATGCRTRMAHQDLGIWERQRRNRSLNAGTQGYPGTPEKRSRTLQSESLGHSQQKCERSGNNKGCRNLGRTESGVWEAGMSGFSRRGRTLKDLGFHKRMQDMPGNKDMNAGTWDARRTKITGDTRDAGTLGNRIPKEIRNNRKRAGCLGEEQNTGEETGRI